jgi:hypothetical protein
MTDKCDLCSKPIIDEVIDGATVYGPWGYMCPDCYRTKGIGLGIGRGQQYMKINNEWKKVAG